jgi:hypothetical protein
VCGSDGNSDTEPRREVIGWKGRPIVSKSVNVYCEILRNLDVEVAKANITESRAPIYL